MYPERGIDQETHGYPLRFWCEHYASVSGRPYISHQTVKLGQVVRGALGHSGGEESVSQTVE